MKFLLVRNKKQYSLYCPDTYGSHSWGSTSQTSIVKKKKFWYVENWTAGNEWVEDEKWEYKLNVVLETSDFDEIIRYVLKYNEKEIEHLIKDAEEIYNDYFSFIKWIHTRNI